MTRMYHSSTRTLTTRALTAAREPLPIGSRPTTAAATGPEDSPYGLHLATERGLTYLLTAPGRPRLRPARTSPATSSCTACTPATPTTRLELDAEQPRLQAPVAGEAVDVPALARALPPPPDRAASAKRRRPGCAATVAGLRHSLGRDAVAIHHHYDVSNAFYEMVLGPSMTYTCALFPTEDATLEEAQDAKYAPGRPQARPSPRPAPPRPRVRLGRHGPARGREYGVHALGVTLSREQAAWARAEDQGGGPRPPRRGRFMDYRHVEERGLRRHLLDRADRAHRREVTTRRTSPSSRTGCVCRADCSTTASPGTTTGSARPAPSSTATSSRTVS